MCVYGPWGYYEGIDSNGCFQAKRITVKRGEKLSLQMHHRHAEPCIVVSGSAHVTCGEKFILLAENKSTYIPLGATHRLEKPGRTAAAMIEVQSGSHLGQDNIVRLEDIWQRACKAVIHAFPIRAFQLRSRRGQWPNRSRSNVEA